MEADVNLAIKKANEKRELYNPDNVSPFPFENIERGRKDLEIIYTNLLEDKISGAISYNKDNDSFSIYINRSKPKTRQYFTVAHELGHLFLHSEFIKSEEIMIDGEGTLDGGRTLFRLDDAIGTKLEIEANNFAASLIMPEDLVRDAWGKVGDVKECAEIFNVSVVAMAIRLEKLGLAND
ncbi:MAG: hypothetical protein A2571_00375 [Candidatus Vogelbacteria bacterium RIFOXYD1_FULL_44_32]|uniref:IrrE N-terminal-like domain-containing protein n=1 Tax=Candidatus Vogelbacteria bacterium RIFOXYD1_FULL_44_32 TaxID=1802438 RepID=A0A1G2QE83_9BACT|nr:MAG: hypothetical protein A2571_00375 [Candidatus Vogelbacteria bacterium RIFOXYD1_FULL_44_32]